MFQQLGASANLVEKSVLRQGTSSEKFSNYWSTLEMREKAMMLSTSGEESQLLAQLILIPVSVLLIVGIVFLCCKYKPCCSDPKQLKAGKGARRDFTSGVKTRIIRTDSPSAAGQVKRGTARRLSPQNDPSADASTLSYDPAHGKNKVNDPQRRSNQHDTASITNNTSSDVPSGPPNVSFRQSQLLPRLLLQ